MQSDTRAACVGARRGLHSPLLKASATPGISPISVWEDHQSLRPRASLVRILITVLPNEIWVRGLSAGWLISSHNSSVEAGQYLQVTHMCNSDLLTNMGGAGATHKHTTYLLLPSI